MNLIQLFSCLILTHVKPMLMHNESENYIRIPCNAQAEYGVKYRKIIWYKTRPDSDAMTGLVQKNLENNLTTRYKRFVNHTYDVGEDFSLLFSPRWPHAECTLYCCSLWPPLGHQFRESQFLYPEGCARPLSDLPITESRLLAAEMYGAVTVLLLLFLALIALRAHRSLTHGTSPPLYIISRRMFKNLTQGAPLKRSHLTSLHNF
ncbi:uncharacterized protein LOC114798720 isoform X1 [Denticeps clupeoides]|uniref:uncharacterized protein LOC114798720 isoform X1 n=1 Tax=Denticeps clupeoides TaxID=299321 RepID=UPI0010A304E6|nr:uncharacterized protein LOC114798720 isoform X1 [Denticeps clupeoides]